MRAMQNSVIEFTPIIMHFKWFQSLNNEMWMKSENGAIDRVFMEKNVDWVFDIELSIIIARSKCENFGIMWYK